MPVTDLLELARRVSDGEPVDWDSAETSASDPDARRVVRNLRLVASLSSFHRGSESSAGSNPESTMDSTETLDHAALRGVDPNAGASAAARFTWGGLEVRELLGSGGFGEVYRAWDPKIQRDVALKLLKREPSEKAAASEAVLHEARLLARVRHPNVVTVHGADVHDGRVGLWMELVQGRSLARWVEEHGRMGAREAAVLGIEMCRALAAVHHAGLVHRDVKAANVMREEGGRILLMDFGAGIDATALEGGNISGTPRYIAPEVYAGSKASERSDIYSLGVLLYYLVTGRYPIDAGTIGELRARALRAESRLLRDERSDLPEPFVRIVERTLAWNPDERFGTAGQMELALSGFLGAEPRIVPADGARTAQAAPAPDVRGAMGAADRGTATDSGSIGARSRRWLVPGTLFALLALAAVVAAGVWMARPAQAPASAVPAGSEAGTATASYTVEASFMRIGRTGTRERLDSGALLALGDQLALDIRASTRLYVYVIDEDDEGSAYALFPLPGLEPGNPLAPDQRHILPGTGADGKQVTWSVTSSGGREHILVLASPEPLVEFEAGMSRLERPREGATATPVPHDVMVRLRGIGGLVVTSTKSPGGEGAAHLFEMADKLAGGSEVVRGPWVRRIDLETAPAAR